MKERGENMVESKPISLLLLLLPLLILRLSSAADPTNPRPQELRSFKIQDPKSQAAQSKVGYGCSYTVSIRTSCSSPRYTRDAISIAFGDAYRNEVYAAHLADPSTGAFERCSTDTFRLTGPCGYGVCYVYLYRQGWDGWVPESVKIYDLRYSGRPVTFYYGVSIPAGVWYGFNHCPRVTLTAARVEVEGNAGDPISQM